MGRDPGGIPLIVDRLGMSEGDDEKAKLVSDSRYLAIGVQFGFSLLFFCFRIITII